MEAKTADKLPGLTVKEMRKLLADLSHVKNLTVELRRDFKSASDKVQKKLDWDYWIADTLDKQRRMMKDAKAAIYDIQESGVVLPAKGGAE